MISHLAIPEGFEMPIDASLLHQALAEILVANRAELEYMQTGVYDVTPKIWTKNTHNHELTVLDNGEGLYRLYPKDSTVGVVEPANGEFGPFKKGGRVTAVNSEQPIS